MSATQSEAQRALAYRLLRLAETYLLQLLTTRGVLPARGFPVDVRELIIVKPKTARGLRRNRRSGVFLSGALLMIGEGNAFP